MITIILAGGEGKRLQPLSSPENPKQFIRFDRFGGSLFQCAYERALMVSEAEDIYIVTNERYITNVEDQINSLGVSAGKSNILGEPAARNTLPAIMAGVMQPDVQNGDIIAVLPADHYIGDNDAFMGILHESKRLASESLVTFGIRPLYAETGYGYIQPGEPHGNGYSVRSFREKPDEKTAVEYIGCGYLWNAGIFMFKRAVFLDEVKRFETDIYNAFSQGGGLFEIFGRIGNGISIDRGILEKSSKVAVVPMDIEWSDLGSFDSIYKIMPAVPFVPDEGDSVVRAGDSYELIRKKDGSLYLRGAKGIVLIN
ncbi:MAG TPA: mannose-1-phosphate guanylyltransferase [Clostridia bacterium]|nr:mannose-1-phosphate guanylyltransferase [Clostridia bacterium]